ncbi:MAG: hypothetical protein WC209_07515 [Ignavibacteriaceae bacterium]|jgi:hypothetical protein
MDNKVILIFLLTGVFGLLVGFKSSGPDLDISVTVNKYILRATGIICTIVGIVGLIAKLFSGC